MLTLSAPATVPDFADVLGICQPAMWAMVRYQARRGPTYAIRNGDTAIVAGGVHMAADFRECWFLIAPAARAHMGSVLRLTRLTLADLCQLDPRPVVTIARTHAGARIANALGFVPVSGGVWRWERS